MRWLAPLWRRPRGGPDLAALAERFVAIDLETTGLDSRTDAVVSLAAIPFVGGEPQPGLSTLVNPGRPIPAGSTAIHGITDDMVVAAPPIGDVLRTLDDALGDAVLVGHGVGFDMAVIARDRRVEGLRPLFNPALDTMRLAAALHQDWTRPALEPVAERLGVTITGRHTADGDAIAAGRILLGLLPTLWARGIRTVPELVWFQETVARQ
jgi:DNA polymerase-3 subunit epsilon